MWMLARLLLCAGLAIGMVGSSAQAQSAMTAGSPELLKPHRIDIGGGRRMNLQCIGRGSPTVVFDQGWGGTILDWAKVQKAVSGLTRACFYDRAGEGWSDPSGRAATVLNVTDDLHALLRRAGVRGPIVLVGHSLGGLYATAYADRFAAQVGGLVLVEPAFAGQDDDPKDPAEQKLEDDLAKRQKDALAACAAAARLGELSPADPHHCFDPKPPFTPAEIGYLLPAYVKPLRWEAMASELGRGDEEFRLARPWGDKPVVVLTRDQFPAAPGQSEAARAAGEALWRHGHDQLAARTSRGRSVTVRGAGHYIQQDQPQAVIDAIREVVDEVRAKPRG